MSEALSILEQADSAIADFLRVNAHNCEPKEFGRLHAKASMGLRLRHDSAVNERVSMDQKLRAINMIAKDPEMRERYIRATAPLMVPQLEARPK
jgi:hypothetical protein